MRFDALPHPAPKSDSGHITNARPGQRGRAQSRKIGLFGLFGIGNFGNDASLEAMVRFLRQARPSAKLLCICGVPDEVEFKLGVRSVRINERFESPFLVWLSRLLIDLPREVLCVAQAVRHLSRLDVIIIPGTGMLDDYATGARGIPYWLFRWCVLARLLGVKIIFVSIGAGPIHHPLSRRLMKAAAKLASYRSYRDEISWDFMRSIGFDVSHDPVYPDIVFSLSESASLPEPNAEGEPTTVGVGVMSYNGWRGDMADGQTIYTDYLGKLQRFVSWLMTAGYRVRILMGDASDLQAVEKLFAMIAIEHKGRSPPSALVEPAYSLHDVLAQIADTDFVVATRFHNIVCALMLGRPTLSIGYAEKNDVLLTGMGLGEYCQHIERLDVDLLIQQFQRLVAGRKAYERTIREASARFKESLRQQEALLLSRYL